MRKKTIYILAFVIVLGITNQLPAQPPGGGGGQGQGGPPPGGTGAPVDGGVLGLLAGTAAYAWYRQRKAPAIKISDVQEPASLPTVTNE